MRRQNHNPPRIPDHHVLRKIGGGTYGEVWMARSVTDVLRAVKVVWRADFEEARDFEREFEGIKYYEPISRKHSGLIPILHVGRSQGKEEFYYYVMELGDDISTGQEIRPAEYEPRNLRTDLRAAQHSALEIDFCLTVGQKMAEALCFLHGQDLAHRDVKPANIIFLNGEPKLADIGLVAMHGQRTFVGTDGFIPPEGPGTKQADVYALGKILYEMSTGMDRLDFPNLPDHPFSGDDPKRGQALNKLVCELCEPKQSNRGVKQASTLVQNLESIAKGRPLKKEKENSPLLKVLAIALIGGGALALSILWPSWSALTSQSVPEPLQKAPVKILSHPIGAEVWSPDGSYLGTTPLAGREEIVGTTAEFEFRHSGFRNTVARQKIVEGGTLIEATLPIFAPPKEGEPWSDDIGMVYRPSGEKHLTEELVSASFFQRFVRNNQNVLYRTATIDSGGERLKVAITNPKQANRFSRWITNISRKNGYLTDEYIIVPIIDHTTKLLDAQARPSEESFRPFLCEVRKIPFGQVTIQSLPAEQTVVYLRGVLMGIARPDQPLTLTKLPPGHHVFVLEAEGYRTQQESVELKAKEARNLVVTLQANQSVVFDREWVNSLEIPFVPVTKTLMAAQWETRLTDYAHFQRATDSPPLPSPGFEQGPNHPVVNLTRDEAIRFCQWLTQKERAEFRIGEQQEYRLPTDLEWSLLAGLEGETGTTPFWRDSAAIPGYPWGEQWPPPSGSGNFADLSASRTVGVDSSRIIRTYEDQFPHTAPVGHSTPNALGLQDLSGNVYEWVSDEFGGGDYGVTRGGSWKTYQQETLHSIFRNPVRKEARDSEVGFRLVLSKMDAP